MMIYKTNSVNPLQAANVQSGTNRGSAVRAGQYDRVEVTNYSEDQRFALELSGKLSREVRMGKTEQLPQLKQQIENNEYSYDLEQLTAQIMLFGGLE